MGSLASWCKAPWLGDAFGFVAIAVKARAVSLAIEKQWCRDCLGRRCWEVHSKLLEYRLGPSSMETRRRRRKRDTGR